MVASRLINGEKGSLPIDVCRSKTSLLKVPISSYLNLSKMAASTTAKWPLDNGQFFFISDRKKGQE